MDETLDQLKGRLSLKYLGKVGIHAIGIRAGSVISVYYSGSHSEERSMVFEQLQRDAAQVPVLLFDESPPEAAQKT